MLNSMALSILPIILQIRMQIHNMDNLYQYAVFIKVKIEFYKVYYSSNIIQLGTIQELKKEWLFIYTIFSSRKTLKMFEMKMQVHID